MSSDLSAEIAEALSEFGEDVQMSLKKTKRVCAKKAAEKLKVASPVASQKHHRGYEPGAYAESWRYTEKAGKLIVHAEDPHYRVTHLLEHGHAKRGGGRVAAKVHIAPVEQELYENIDKEFVKILG